jgi:hypothetical protein
MGREWAHGRNYPSSAHRASLLKDWLEHYNHRRPHSAIGNRPPINRVRNVQRQDSYSLSPYTREAFPARIASRSGSGRSARKSSRTSNQRS